MEQISLFDGTKPFNITKPIRLIELFAGYGSQHYALEYLGVKFESWKICEWAVKSIQAYKDAHFKNDNINYSKNLIFSQVVDYLTWKGISANYNEPMTQEQIKRLGETKCRQIYNNIKATHNLVNICETTAQDLEIVDTDKYCYIMTYSFPCQDLSKAGLGKGMEKGSGTRSGMLWEVERILDECKELPQVLLMENVPDVIGEKNIKSFSSWLEKLESLGYHCYWKVLNAKDFGVPQNRERCFMVSILGDYYYEFPQRIELNKKLKDLLEDNVDENFYLSDKMKDYIVASNSKWTGNNDNAVINRDIGVTINTRVGNTRADCSDYICNELPENTNLKTKLCNTLIQKGQVKEFDVIRHSYSNSRLENWKERGVETNNISPTLDTRCDCLGVVKDYRIRKLTPRECFRLMGVKDKDFENIAQNQSNASLYHLAGDSIVTNVLMAIFKKICTK